MAITAESLADGSVLTLLIMRFNGMQTEENLMSVLQCLRDSHVWAPMSLLVKDDETNMLREAKEGDKFEKTEEVPMTPKLLTDDDGEFYLPVFSHPTRFRNEFGEDVSRVHIPFIQCVDMALALDNVQKINVNAFTDNLILPKELLEIIKDLPSSIVPQS